MGEIYSGTGMSSVFLGSFDNGEIYKGHGFSKEKVGEYENGEIYRIQGFLKEKVGECDDGEIYKVSAFSKDKIGECEDELIYKPSVMGQQIIGKYNGDRDGAAAASLLLLFEENNVIQQKDNADSKDNTRINTNKNNQSSFLEKIFIGLFLFIVIGLVIETVGVKNIIMTVIFVVLSIIVIVILYQFLRDIIIHYKDESQKRFDNEIENFKTMNGNKSNDEIIEEALKKLKNCELNNKDDYELLSARIQEYKNNVKNVVEYNKWFTRKGKYIIWLISVILLFFILDFVGTIMITEIKDYLYYEEFYPINYYLDFGDPLEYVIDSFGLVALVVIVISIIFSTIITEKITVKLYEMIINRKLNLIEKCNIYAWEKKLNILGSQNGVKNKEKKKIIICFITLAISIVLELLFYLFLFFVL